MKRHLELTRLTKEQHETFQGASPFAMIAETDHAIYIVDGKLMELITPCGSSDIYEIDFLIDGVITFQNNSGKNVNFTYEEKGE